MKTLFVMYWNWASAFQFVFWMTVDHVMGSKIWSVEGRGLHSFQQHSDLSMGLVQFPVLWVLGGKTAWAWCWPLTVHLGPQDEHWGYMLTSQCILVVCFLMQLSENFTVVITNEGKYHLSQDHILILLFILCMTCVSSIINAFKELASSVM
jgi:hypothetical protein